MAGAACAVAGGRRARGGARAVICAYRERGSYKECARAARAQAKRRWRCARAPRQQRAAPRAAPFMRARAAATRRNAPRARAEERVRSSKGIAGRARRCCAQARSRQAKGAKEERAR